jgi:ribose 5-phosphate isomerase RpiB
MKGVLEVKEIRVFANSNKFTLTKEVNDFLKSTEYKVIDIQYGSSGGLFFSEYSVMIVIEVNRDEG